MEPPIQPLIHLNLNFKIMLNLWIIVAGSGLLIFVPTATILLYVFFFSMIG